MKDHKHYELCRRAHLNTSFRPEKRAEYYCQHFDATQAELKELGARPESIEKSERLFIAWMSAKGNCLSSMITGPARFPVAKAEKANRSEENRGREFLDHFERVTQAIKREQYFEANPDARPISNSDDDALTRLKAKLEKLEAERELNNAINKIVRRKPKAEFTEEKGEELRKLGLNDRVIAEVFKPDFCGGVGIPAYVNQNLGGNIKRVKERIAELEKTKQIKTERIDLGNDVFATQDPEAMRVFFEFPGKPDDETRSLLKSKGFRWTPSQGHWGRKLTGNASHAARQVMDLLTSPNDPRRIQNESMNKTEFDIPLADLRELLEALQIAQDIIRRCDNAGIPIAGDYEGRAAQQTIAAAIAKAEGGNNV